MHTLTDNRRPLNLFWFDFERYGFRFGPLAQTKTQQFFGRISQTLYFAIDFRLGTNCVHSIFQRSSINWIPIHWPECGWHIAIDIDMDGTRTSRRLLSHTRTRQRLTTKRNRGRINVTLSFYSTFLRRRTINNSAKSINVYHKQFQLFTPNISRRHTVVTVDNRMRWH